MATIVLILSVWSVCPLLATEPERPPAKISRYELATHQDLLLSHLVVPKMVGDVDVWAKQLLNDLPGQVGDWVTQFFDAKSMANIITEAFPIEGQPALQSVDNVVRDCARILDVDKPTVYVRNAPLTRLYSVEAYGRTYLILTSGLLNLLENRPEELRFFVGRELGHVKCRHIELKRKAYAVLSAIQRIDAAVVPDKFQNVLPLLALGRVLTWSREAEFSADRAGLLCCREPKVAYEAIMRMQHGLSAGSRWIDPEAKDFDPEAVIRTIDEWQYRPFIKFILYIRQQPLEHPYYYERLAMLKAWADRGDYRKILARAEKGNGDELIEVTKIQAFELASEGQSVDPYVIVSDGDQQILRTRNASAVREAQWHGFKSTDPGVLQPLAFRKGQPLFFEVWDSNFVTDSLIGGFVIYPDPADAQPTEDGD